MAYRKSTKKNLKKPVGQSPYRGRKIYIDYDRQIEKLKLDGLEIQDEKRAKERLKWEGYYNFAVGYNRLFKDEKRRYIKGTKFEHIEALYDFDRRIRDVVYEATQVVECNLKALVSDKFSRRYGVDERGYLTEQNFTNDPLEQGNVRWLLGTCKEVLKDGVKKTSGGYRDYIEHYAVVYGHVPLWALIRAISFGNTSRFLRLMKKDDKEEIAKEYSLKGKTLCNMTEILVNFRNIAAHGERVYSARLPSVRLTPSLSAVKKLSLPLNADGTQRFGKCDFLAFLICIKYLLSPAEYAYYHERVVKETERLAAVLPKFAMQRVYDETGLKGAWRKLDAIILDKHLDRYIEE